MSEKKTQVQLGRTNYLRSTPAMVVAVLLVVCVVASYVTRDAVTNRDAAQQPAAANQKSPVDDRLVQTARQLALLADTAAEQVLAREALRLSDHEINQAFATAMREAAAPSAPANGPVKQLIDRIAFIRRQIALDQERIAKLTQEAARSDDANSQLQLAKAQIALEQDELEDAQNDLARRGGDPQAKLESAREEHEAAQRQPDRMPKFLAAPTVTLGQHLQAWLALGERKDRVEAARLQAAGRASTLGREHDALSKLTKEMPGSTTSMSDAEFFDTDEEEDPATMLARLRGLSEKTRTLAELGKRIQDTQRLADVYKRWFATIEASRQAVLHLLIGSIGWILAVLLVAIVITRAIRRAFDRQGDRRRLEQLRVMAGIAVQFVAAVVILLIVFGVPSQASTVIGLATAGLTVALKDFIVAFFGWFALMGRNGIRAGDWVEIKGVGGEVLEIGLLRTVLLEVGNWSNTGHLTGRRVSFVNSFAIEGHYFNFSTAGQWFWDELQVSVPPSDEPHETAQQIREMVERETAADAAAAEREWERVTSQYGIRPFSGKPAVDLRPSGHGLDVAVRYITRAPQRYAVKARLYESIVDLLHRPAVTEKR